MNNHGVLNRRISDLLKSGYVLRKWEMGRTNFLCEACEKEHFPATAVYVSAAKTLEEIKEDPAATCEMVLGTGCAKRIHELSLIEKL